MGTPHTPGPAGLSQIALHTEPTDLAGLLRSTLKPLVDQAAQQGIEVRVDEWELPEIAVDREKLAWAVVTLVGNALRYVRREAPDDIGGSVLVHLRAETPEEIWVAVHDDGPGIAEDKLPYLFSRKPGSAHAFGLALSLVQDVVVAHGGRIVVESRRDASEHGTSISIVLPVRARR